MTWNTAAPPKPGLATASHPVQATAREGCGDQVLVAPEHLRDARIIIADDEPAIGLLMKRMLRQAGYRNVTVTTEGAQVGALCASSDPDLVIVDLLMPDRNGFDIVDEVRTLTGGAVPVLVVSGQDRSTVMKQALACGARDFLSKPFETGEALLRIRNLLDTRALHLRSLAAAETRYRDLVESATDLICRADVTGEITYANPSATAVLGEGAEGSDFFRFVRADQRKQVRAFYCAQMKSRTRSTVREIPLVINGAEIWVEQKVCLDLDGDHVQGLSGIARDITARRVQERVKNELISVVSHELRTPLTAIRGTLGLLSGGVLQAYPERAARMVELALGNAQRLNRLIENLLDLEKMESGTMEIEPRAFPLREVAREALDSVRPLLEKEDLFVVEEIPSVTVCVDPDRVVQVLTNLLSNAIKFSPRGGTIWLRAIAEGGDAHLEVRDQGRGIPADKLESVFERFQQVDSSDSRDKGGTGLGLPICRNIVALHGGRIWAESNPGAGTTMRAIFPGRVVDPRVCAS